MFQENTFTERLPPFLQFFREQNQNPRRGQVKTNPKPKEGRSRRRAWSPHLWELVTWELVNAAQRVRKSFPLDPGSPLFPGRETDGGRSLLKLSELNKQANKTKQQTHESGSGQRKHKPRDKRELLFCLLFGRARVCTV